MCGIVGYVGAHDATDTLINGLSKLEYRGYDSAGLVVLKGDDVMYERTINGVDDLRRTTSQDDSSSCGIAHTRWATHGPATIPNAHPHHAGDVYIVHNGIIENYQDLKKELQNHGRQFVSDTDTEVLAHLIDEAYATSLEDAVAQSLERVRGTYAIAVIHTKQPERIIVARYGSPLIIGIGRHGHYIASDTTALVEYTRDVVYLDDGDIVCVQKDKFTMVRGNLHQKTHIPFTEKEASRGGYEHFMLKEIHEQPDVVIRAMQKRTQDDNSVIFEELRSLLPKLMHARHIYLTGCGTSYHAALFGARLLELYAHIPAEVVYASEFEHRDIPLGHTDVVVGISQSGETADTLAALRRARTHGALTIGIVNVVGSTIARESNAVLYTHAGPEISVASSKAFVSQCTVLTLFSVYIGREYKTLSETGARAVLTALKTLPRIIQTYLDTKAHEVQHLAHSYASYENMLFLGRGASIACALESALKIKEIAYIHAEGYPTGELKHGVIALTDNQFPSIILAPRDSTYAKSLAGLEEIKARNGRVCVVTTPDGLEAIERSNDAIVIPKTLPELQPLLMVVALQLFAYYLAVARGTTVDRPRNLAKSVTVA